MGEFGQITIFLAMGLSAVGGALALGGRQRETVRAGEGFLLAAAAAAAAALFALVYALLIHDYRIAYVHDHANRTMGIGYLVTAVWGGQAGSLLFWAVLQTWYTAGVVLFAKKRPRIALGFLAALQVYFFALVLFHSNPFAPLGRIAESGLGMNPLLLNPYMTVHPPTLFLGFVGFSVPVAYVFAALARDPSDDRWLAELRPFVLFAWGFLSVGNLLGMVWAYQELGWGGYWGWDPVENASFMPWLTSTALLHTMSVQQRKPLFRLLNPTLMVVTFCLIVFGTFITRSGVIQSVHAFSEATVGPWLLGLICVLGGLYIALAVWRRRALASGPAPAGGLSRESLFSVTAWLLLLSTAFIWIGTMAPLFTELLRGETVASTPAFFNKWMVPLGLALFAVLALCLTLARSGIRKLDRADRAKLPRVAALPAAAGVGAAALGAAIWRPAGPWPVIAFLLIGIAAASVTREIYRAAGTWVRARDSRAQGRRRLGAQLVHLSVVFLYIGFVGAAFDEETSAVMRPGETMTAGDYTLRFVGLREKNDYRRYALFGDVAVSRQGAHLGTFSMARFSYHSHPNQPTSEVAIRTGLAEDLFLILGGVDKETGAATVRAVVNPLVAWIWIGGAVLVLGTLVGFGREAGAERPRVRPAGARRRFLYYLLPVAVVAAITATARPSDTALVLVGTALAAAVLLMGGAVFRLTGGVAR